MYFTKNPPKHLPLEFEPQKEQCDFFGLHLFIFKPTLKGMMSATKLKFSHFFVAPDTEKNFKNLGGKTFLNDLTPKKSQLKKI
jgi:hypothetical protein